MELKPGDKCPMCAGAFNGDGKMIAGPKFQVRQDIDDSHFPPLLRGTYFALRYKCNKCQYRMEVRIDAPEAKKASARGA